MAATVIDRTLTVGAHLRSGGFGSAYMAVYDGKTTVLKVFEKEEQFRQESKAYEAIAGAPALRDRIPTCFGVVQHVRDFLRNAGHETDAAITYENGLCIDFVEGDALEDVIHLLTSSQLAQIYANLRETITRLHRDARISHGDCFPNNVILRGDFIRLIDFSHPGFRDELSAEEWGVETEHDFNILQNVFEDGTWVKGAPMQHNMPARRVLGSHYSLTPDDPLPTARLSRGCKSVNHGRTSSSRRLRATQSFVLGDRPEERAQRLSGSG